ncbi:MAG: rRNA maturation RNase YbeY [Zoogloeaceae bacterium]|nr:rRNA maturation RNase YbeY [Zoogloeaceae bacterium]
MSAKPRSGASAAKPALHLTVQYAVVDDLLPTRAEVRRWARAAHGGGAELTVRFVDAEEGRDLNARYRGKDYATNVLTFSYPHAPLPQGDLLQGDLALCVPVALREAVARGKPAAAHFAHLVVHGMLHLQGYDHETDADAGVMEQEERRILSRLGFPDPY